MKPGDYVNVINSTMSGTFFYEGRARIVEVINEAGSMYAVDFGDDHGAVERFVDPKAQTDKVAHYIADLNAA